MKVKDFFKSDLPVILLSGFIVFIGSCTDDKIGNDSKNSEQKGLTLEMVEQQDAVACVLWSLAGVEREDSTGLLFEGKRYEPTIGRVRDESQPSERGVLADSTRDAVLSFRALVSNEVFVKETSDGYVIDLTDLSYRMDGSKQNLGKLTFHYVTDGSCLGYVDVEIPCIPSLERITYLTKDQWGTNGWVDGGWESPCLFGQVWLNVSEGLYYVCVKESTSDTDGWLLNVQYGRGNMYSTLAKNEGDKGAWKPKHPASKEAIENYVKLCIDGQYYDMKQAIRIKYPGKIFPAVPKSHGKGQKCIWDCWPLDETGDDGFGTSQKGYGHWVGGTHNESTWYRAGDGPEVFIIRDAWFGSYAWIPARKWRKQEVYVMAPRARYDSSRYWYTKSYVYTTFEDSDYCDWMNQKFPYTANGYSFRGTPPSGFGSTPVFDPAI